MVAAVEGGHLKSAFETNSGAGSASAPLTLRYKSTTKKRRISHSTHPDALAALVVFLNCDWLPEESMAKIFFVQEQLFQWLIVSYYVEECDYDFSWLTHSIRSPNVFAIRKLPQRPQNVKCDRSPGRFCRMSIYFIVCFLRFVVVGMQKTGERSEESLIRSPVAVIPLE